MTHSIDSPFPPPPSTGSGATSGATTATTSTTSTGSPSTSDVAKDEARNVGQTAAQAGSQVASTAADQAREVAHETQRQAQDLLHQGRQQLRQQTVAQQHKAASGLSSLAQELRGLADGSSQGAPGPARDLLQQASGYVEQFADRLQSREPADLLDDVRAFARRRPGTFLLGAALAGVLAGRLTSGVKAAHSDGSSTGSQQQYRTDYTQTDYVEPAPAYSGYAETTSYETTTGYSGTAATGSPVPPPPYGTTPPAGAVVPPTTPAGWDDPARRPGQGV
jgi:ElaB/YqjD/DUF883 family membrane-anchored ribosome-binding protein